MFRRSPKNMSVLWRPSKVFLKVFGLVTLGGVPLFGAGTVSKISAPSENPRNLTPQQIKADQKLEALISARVQSLLNKMTVEEKVGQMTQLTLDAVAVKESLLTEKPQIDPAKLQEALLTYHVGSILNVAGDKAHSLEHWHQMLKEIQDVALSDRLKIPVLYGIDSIHGAHYTLGATLFPQALAMAATWDPRFSQRAGEITALETRISGIPWNFFPVLDVGRQPLWPRLYETYGEDVLLAEKMGWANIIGQQGVRRSDLSSPSKVAACMKHYVGYSFPWSGKDRTPAIITERLLREKFLPTFEAAVKAGAETVMINSAEIDGIPGHANRRLITEILKGELRFKGFAVSDWEDIKRLYTRDHMADSPEEAVRMAVMAGVDMSMVPFDLSFAQILVKLVKSKKVPMNRIDDAVRRILRVKYLVGLFEQPYPTTESNSQFGAKEFRTESQQMASEGITLLKNRNNLLPLSTSQKMKILVTGPTAHSLEALNGGWTLTWQGGKADFFPKDRKTIFNALSDEFGAENTEYLKGVSFSEKAEDYERALREAGNADLVVLCLGEKPYTETPGNIEDLDLDSVQLDFAKDLYKKGKPVVLVMVTGRPRILREIEPGADAIIMSYLPGMEGAAALSDILVGKVNPSGKLPITYPRFSNSLITYDHKVQEIKEGNVYNPQWPFGFGLSYSKFVYKKMTLSDSVFDRRRGMTITVEVSNESLREGKETVQLYLTDVYRSLTTPSVKQLVDFKKVSIPPGQTVEVKFELKVDQLSFIAPNLERVVENGEFILQVDQLQQSFQLK